MKGLKHFSDQLLLENFTNLVQEERRITLDILRHLREVEERRLHAMRGFGSLFEYCVKHLGYSESATYRRISAMRALKVTPELEESIQSGRLTVSIVSRVQTFLRSDKIRNQKNYDPHARRELFHSLEGKSSQEVEKTLLGISPEAALPRERERAVTAELTEIRFTADDALMEKLKKLKDLYSHQLQQPGSYSELFSILADHALKAKDSSQRDSRPKRTVATAEVKAKGEVQKAKGEVQNPAVTRSSSRFIPRALHREVWRRANHRCAYVDPMKKRKCGSSFRLQIEHIHPFSMGGSSRDLENLTLLCATHNQLSAIRIFGVKKMSPHFQKTR